MVVKKYRIFIIPEISKDVLSFSLIPAFFTDEKIMLDFNTEQGAVVYLSKHADSLKQYIILPVIYTVFIK